MRFSGNWEARLAGPRPGFLALGRPVLLGGQPTRPRPALGRVFCPQAGRFEWGVGLGARPGLGWA